MLVSLVVFFRRTITPVAWKASTSDLKSSAERILMLLQSAYLQAFTYPSNSARGDTRSPPSSHIVDSSVAWDDTVTLSPDASPRISLEIRASFEFGRMLGQGELIGKLEMSLNELFDHGDESFDISFPPIQGVHPTLTLKAASVHPCGNDDGGLFDSIVDCEIARDTDAGHARMAEYMTSDAVSDLNYAVEHFQLVLDRCPVSHPDRAAALTNLAWARLEGYIREDLQDIDSTASLLRDALALRPQDHSDHTLSLYHLANVLNWRHLEYQHTTADICESAQLYHELLPLCPEGTYLRSIAAGENGVDYVIKECNALPTDGSDEGVQLRRIVLELCPLGHQHHLSSLSELSLSLHTCFIQCGNIDDIDESIQLHRDLVSLCPEGCDDHDTYLHNLAASIDLRFDQQGKPDDLDEAICLHEEVLHRCPVGHESRDISLDYLGNALCACFAKCGDVNVINRAIGLYREALILRPPGHPDRQNTLHNLALALNTRYDKLHVSEDVNEVIDLYRESLRLKQHDHPERHVTLYNLSAVLCSRFTESQKNEDVEEAIGLCQESLAALPSLHPSRYFSYMRLRHAYLPRYRVQFNPADLSLAMENFRLASRHPTQGFPNRIRTAWKWASSAERHSHASALEAYTTCFELLESHLATRPSATSRREAAAAFRRARTLPVDAASCALRHHNLQKAVELVEQGRGQQWSQASRLRTPLEDLESANPDLAHTFLELSKRVSDAAQGSAAITDRAANDRAAIEYRRLTEQWEAVVAETRTLQGFSRFLLTPSYEELQAAASHGPILVQRNHYPNVREPYNVPFSSLALADLMRLKDDFAREIRHAALMGPTEPRKDLRALLRKVWDNIMLPIVNVLQHVLKLPRRSRIWLCPTAAFTSIPLHAAHPFRTKAEPCLEELYICSYTPTLSALIRSRQMMKMRATPSFIAIGQSQPGAGQGTVLAAVDSELELVHSMLYDAIPGAPCLSWKQDRDQPYNSRFAMRDEPLTLLDIMENNAPQAEFAFLSACHTAVGDEETPDEVIHLAAGLQFSGFKSVIGTLWAVDDAVAKHVVEGFYKNMFKKKGVIDCTRAALALKTMLRIP
ncbi:hypothetical protein DFH29DRAFT_872259 [Suillus ampliporus]|nr:hypothetical protein DFH29DRAFT_872259 [Suillus ampliporus]